MTEQEIREAEERAKKATSGQWWVSGGYVFAGDKGDIVCELVGYRHPQTIIDADLFCHARADILNLCKEVRRLRAEVRRPKGALPPDSSKAFYGFFADVQEEEER